MVKGEDSVTAAQHAFGDLKKLQQALDNYVSQGNFQMFRLKQATVVNEASFGAKPIAMADVDAQRAGVLLGTGRKQDAQTLLESVLQSDPKNALAHETMGMLKYGEGRRPKRRDGTARPWNWIRRATGELLLCDVLFVDGRPWA